MIFYETITIQFHSLRLLRINRSKTPKNDCILQPIHLNSFYKPLYEKIVICQNNLIIVRSYETIFRFRVLKKF